MILLALDLVQWAAGFLVLGRLRGCGGAQRSSGPEAGDLSVVIPARDEERNLPRLLQSLGRQSPQPGEIVVVDDGSADQTAEVARRNGARVVASGPLPEGWRGKTWACQQGARNAAGKYLLFLDADTWFEPGGLARALAAFPGREHGALSVAPRHRVRAFHEQFSAFFNLVMLAGTGAFTPLGDRYRGSGLLGQFLLIDRATYERVGGHSGVKGRILENVRLAKQVRAAGVPTRCRCGQGVFAVRMYPDGWRSLIEGWAKGFASGAGQTPLPLLVLIIAWLAGLACAPIGLLTQHAPVPWLFCYALCAAQTGCLLRRAGTFHGLVAVFYPVFLVFFFAVFARSVLRSGGSVTWKGRVIPAG